MQNKGKLTIMKYFRACVGSFLVSSKIKRSKVTDYAALRLIYLRNSGASMVVEHGSEVIKLSSCSTKLSMIFIMLINVKMPTVVGI